MPIPGLAGRRVHRPPSAGHRPRPRCQRNPGRDRLRALPGIGSRRRPQTQHPGQSCRRHDRRANGLACLTDASRSRWSPSRAPSPTTTSIETGDASAISACCGCPTRPPTAASAVAARPNPSAPIARSIKAGRTANTDDRVCLCTGLLVTAGLDQRRNNGYVEPPVATGGTDDQAVAHLTARRPADGGLYTAHDVIDHLTRQSSE